MKLKLLVESWRKFVVEAVSTTTAYFFDFDETLAFDDNPTFLYQLDPDGQEIYDAEGELTGKFGNLIATIDNQVELDHLMKRFGSDPDYYFDFSRSKFVNEPVIISQVMDVFVKQLSSKNNVVSILTARGNDVQDDLFNFIDSILIEKGRNPKLSEKLNLFTLGTGTYGTQNKGEFMVQFYIDNPEIKNIVFYEDSATNLARAVEAFESEKFTKVLSGRNGKVEIFRVEHGTPNSFYSTNNNKKQ